MKRSTLVAVIAAAALALTASAVQASPHYLTPHDWLYRAFLCIHSGEGAWNAIDSTGTFFGGLQMDRTFQSEYGAADVALYGTADRWPPWVQINVARRAYYSGRGFYPWPHTARACGLL